MTHLVILFPVFTSGDTRRPYPTDYEMRAGWLAKINDITTTGTPALQVQGSYGEPMPSSRLGATG